MDISKLPALAQKAEQANKKISEKLKKCKPKNLDDVAQGLHNKAFEEIDCLKCANCCKTTSPIFYQRDIEKLSKYLKLKPSQFIEKYLHVDEDKDYVLNSTPCPFLDGENYCMVYNARPTACSEYPHTNRKRFYQLLNLTVKNTHICPAAYKVFEGLKEVFK
ncbi:MAG: YkgJ family cysteine cluster protein [Bacteroidetes bacterium]|nr:YkgJ family cysteine cluster protein [Bacteroidota bacterium]